MSRRALWGFAPVLIIGAVIWRERFSGFHQRVAERHFAQSEAYAHEGDTEGARREMALALKEDPKYTEARDALATIYSTNGKRAEAIRLYNEGIALQPRSVSLRYDLAELYFTDRQYDKAIPPLERGARIDPDCLPCQRLLGLCYERAGRLEDARRFWKDCSRRHPEDVSLAHSVVRIERQIKDSARPASAATQATAPRRTEITSNEP